MYHHTSCLVRMQSLPEGSGPVLLKRHVVVSLNKCPCCRQLNPVSRITAAECARVTLTPQAERRTTLLEALYAVGLRRRCTLGAVGAPGHSRMFPLLPLFPAWLQVPHCAHCLQHPHNWVYGKSVPGPLWPVVPTFLSSGPRPGLVGQVSSGFPGRVARCRLTGTSF